MDKILLWILTESNAPKDIREHALDLYTKDRKLVGKFEVSVSDYHRMVEYVRNGQIIQAIKVLRDVTGAALKDAKEAVDGWKGSV